MIGTDRGGGGGEGGLKKKQRSNVATKITKITEY
jgi:hypothetical protein